MSLEWSSCDDLKDGMLNRGELGIRGSIKRRHLAISARLLSFCLANRFYGASTVGARNTDSLR